MTVKTVSFGVKSIL